MKITQNKYPLINFTTRRQRLTDPAFRAPLLEKINTSEYEEDALYKQEYEQFISDLAHMREIKTYLVAHTVSEYLFDHSTRLITKMWPFLTNLATTTGALLWNDWTYFYRKFEDKDKDTAVILYLIVQGDTREMGAILKTKGEEDIRSNPTNTVPEQIAFLLSILFLPFLEFAECETKIVNATTSKKATLNNEKYITDIASNIEIVDSNWFTTLIRTDAFMVSGHFRLQPCGMGRTQRKMIWIKDFAKQGYTKRSHLEIQKEEAL